MHPLLRFTLDLFESNQPPALAGYAPPAINNIVSDKDPGAAKKASSSATPPAAGRVADTPPISFRHPRASREVRLGHILVAYEFNRGQRRSIGFSVGADGLAVRAPKWMPLREVDAALQTKADWILRKLQETRERHARLAAHVIDWRDGATLPFLGQTLTLKLDPERRIGAAGAHLLPLSARDDAATPMPDGTAMPGSALPPHPAGEGWGGGLPFKNADQPPDTAAPAPAVRILSLRLPHHASREQIRDAVQAWLMRQARQIFQARLDHFAPLLGVQWKKLALSNAGTRWGSARADGAIRLNWRLVHFKMSVLDYVVAHELSHLRVMDHSPRFWDTVRTVMPDYAVLRQQLKSEAMPKWD